MPVELLPCPFCFDIPILTSEPCVAEPDYPYVLSCSCGAQIVLPCDSNEDDIYRQWNQRAKSDDALKTSYNIASAPCRTHVAGTQCFLAFDQECVDKPCRIQSQRT